MAQNHVFYWKTNTFVSFRLLRKASKNDAQRDAQSHCKRGALTAAPLEETGESVLVARHFGNGENGEPAKITSKIVPQIITNLRERVLISMQNL